MSSAHGGLFRESADGSGAAGGGENSVSIAPVARAANCTGAGEARVHDFAWIVAAGPCQNVRAQPAGHRKRPYSSRWSDGASLRWSDGAAGIEACFSARAARIEAWRAVPGRGAGAGRGVGLRTTSVAKSATARTDVLRLL